MTKRYVHNPTASTIFAGGVMIPPGEGRDVDALFLPPEGGDEAAVEQAPPDPLDNLRDLLKASVKDLLPQLEDLGTDTLVQLEQLEGEKAQPRSTLLAAIAELKLQRAAALTGGTGT